MNIYFVVLGVLTYVNWVFSLSCCCDIIQSVYGFVGGGNRTAFNIVYPESFDICLISEIGDADLYISDKNPNPTYDPNSYLLHSATCGEDIVHISKKLRRPIYVSVFGHPSYDTTRFYLNIVARESSEEDAINFELLNFDEDLIQVPNLQPEKLKIDLIASDNVNSTTNQEEKNNSLSENINDIKSFNSQFQTNENDYAIPKERPEDMERLMWGLSVENVFLNLIKVYCDPGNLVFILGTNVDEENYFISELMKQNILNVPKIITAENSITERESIYTEGGVLFISSRIIVVDLLKHRIPIKQITGFLIYRSHKIMESCQDGFALRLYRLENKTGFIKAFSSSPESFTRGFARVERVMKTLFVCNLYLWPRFQAVVNSSLEKFKPEVIELHLQLTPLMLELQTSLLDLISYVVKEIKRLNPVLDTDEVTVENALSASFHRLLQIQLDPVWHQLSAATKQLLADLKTLRHILLSLTQTDCVRFNNLLSSLRSTEYAHRSSGWVLLDSAETVFVTANQRMYNSKNEVDPEFNPKWQALDEILKEIRTASNEPEVVLILVSNIEICKQLKEYLIKGGKQLLSDLYKRYFIKRDHSGSSGSAQVVSELVEEDDANNNCFTLSQQQNATTGCVSFVEISEENIGVEPTIIIQPFKKENDVLSLPKTLQMHKPRYVIMYDADVTAIRQIEVFQNSHVDVRMTVYFPIYAGAVEEQAYLTTLRRERSAFEFLISEKSSMVIPAEQDGKHGDCPELTRDSGRSVMDEFHNTRKGGLPTSTCNPLVIVDVREFRSELPVLLHRRGIDIDPVTLQIGDYILTPEMCVERKSINDLIGSLNSGRLYQQAVAMTRHYAKPMLLIEFDQNKAFDLQGRYYLSREMSSVDITAKLQLLTLHFPKLKFVWSPSPYATAQLFQEIKEGKPEPNSTTAINVGQEDGTVNEEKYNAGITDFLSKLPGITTQNFYSVVNKVNSLDRLLTYSQEQLKDVLGNGTHSKELFSALHDEFRNTEKQTTSLKRTKTRGFRAINTNKNKKKK